MTYVGIDPGKGGGLAALSTAGRVLMATSMPATKAALVDLLIQLPTRSTVMLEQVHATPQMGVVSAFTFGRGFGILEGVLEAFRFEVRGVAPLKWMNALKCRTRGDKNITKQRAADMFPQIRVTHATADALLLAEYCRRLDAGDRTTRLVLEHRRR